MQGKQKESFFLTGAEFRSYPAKQNQVNHGSKCLYAIIDACLLGNCARPIELKRAFEMKAISS